jgi:hypothetical protein
MSTTVPLVSEWVMTQTLNWQKNSNNTGERGKHLWSLYIFSPTFLNWDAKICPCYYVSVLFCFFLKSSEVGIATGLRIGRPSNRDSIRKRSERFLFSTASRPPLRSVKPPIQCLPWAPSPRKKR